MQCDEIVRIAQEEIVASQILYGNRMLSGSIIKDEHAIVDFLSAFGDQLLSPTKYSFLDSGFKCDDVDILCLKYNKIVLSRSLQGVFFWFLYSFKTLFVRAKNKILKVFL